MGKRVGGEGEGRGKPCISPPLHKFKMGYATDHKPCRLIFIHRIATIAS